MGNLTRQSHKIFGPVNDPVGFDSALAQSFWIVRNGGTENTGCMGLGNLVISSFLCQQNC